MEIRQQVYHALRQIPKGKISTYKDIAVFLGIPTKFRWVGRLLGENEDIEYFPCYKVVGINGKLTGYSASGGVSEKMKRLSADGVAFLPNGNVDMAKSRWNAFKKTVHH